MTIPMEAVYAVLAALVVGALLPLLFQLRATAKTAGRVIEDLGEKVGAGMADLQKATRQLREELAAAQGTGSNVARMAAHVEDLTRSLGRMQHSLRVVSAVGAAVGPAIAAAITTMRGTNAAASQASDEDGEESEGEAEEGGDGAGSAARGSRSVSPTGAGKLVEPSGGRGELGHPSTGVPAAKVTRFEKEDGHGKAS